MKYGLHEDGRKCGPIDPEKIGETGWTWYDTQAERDAAIVIPIETLRADKAEEIKLYGLGLIQSRVPEIDTEWALALMKRLWPHLNTPDSDPDLAYARDVYVYMMNKLDQLSTATREQIESYDPEADTGWP